MFPGYPNASGKIVGKLRTDPAKKAIVAEGWPVLQDAMVAASITTPRRVAAALTTWCFESLLEYNILQGGSNIPTGLYKPDGTYVGYPGRGLTQLTGKKLPDGTIMNYTPAGRYLGIDLVNHPELAQSLQWSAKIATWYWTKARPRCNEYADNLQMGKVNAAIGYPLSGSNDSDRCMVFGKALQYLTGSVPPGINCAR